MSDNPYLDRFDAIDKTLKVITDKLGNVVPATPAGPAVNWWRNPGAPLPDNPPTCYDDVVTACRYAAQGFRPSGIRTTVGNDLVMALALADKLADPSTTAETADALLNGAAYIDVGTAIFALLTGYVQGFPAGLGGAPRLMTVKGRIADLIHPEAAPIGGNIAGQ